MFSILLGIVSSLLPFLPDVRGNETLMGNATDDTMMIDYDLSFDVFNNETNCTNDYCVSDEEYLNMMVAHVTPDFSDWIFIMMHLVVFMVGFVGNWLVCYAVYRNHSMRTVTNYFIVNLAVADLLVIIICLPPTVLWDVTDTWFLGLRLCQAVPYLQTVSVSVSVMTLTFISLDRWHAICFPLRFKSTTTKAKKVIFVIWLFAFLFDVPELLVLKTFPSSHLPVKTIFFTQCATSWSKKSEMIFTFLKITLLYLGPMFIIAVAYYRIGRVLWRSNIPGHNLSGRMCHQNEISSSALGNPEGQLRSRRKAAKMLVAVAIMFGICYFPVHSISILRHIIHLPSNKYTTIMCLLAHWLCYANSAVNPLIYNFMSGKFRKEFKRTICRSRNDATPHRGVYKFAGTSNITVRRSQMLTRSIHTTTNNTVRQSVEAIPLSAITNSQQIDKND